jgi:CHAD domain-containing protein
MNRSDLQKLSRLHAASDKVDVLKHLAESLNSQGRRYRKRLRQCQEHFSEEAVHDSRVETRRLLATVELLAAFLPERKICKVRDALKQHLDTFDDLRDTQVQLVYVKRMTRAFPAARPFHEWLENRESKFTRGTRRTVKDIKTKRIADRLACFEEELCRQRKHMTRERAFADVMKVMTRSFDRVAKLCRKVKAADTDTIHRTRIAFKRFRYMTEALAPLLPAVTDQHRQAMRGYQSMMGDIQDVEVLLTTLDKFLWRKEIKSAAAARLRNELLRRRQWLIQVYLNAAGRLRQFWPPPRFAAAHNSRHKAP